MTQLYSHCFDFVVVKKLKGIKVYNERKCHVACKKDRLNYAPWVNSADRAIKIVLYYSELIKRFALHPRGLSLLEVY